MQQVISKGKKGRPAGNTVFEQTYRGPIEHFKRELTTHRAGNWDVPKPNVYRHRGADGVGLHISGTTGTIWLDGPHGARKRVENAVLAALSKLKSAAKPLNGEFASIDEFVDYFISLCAVLNYRPRNFIKLRARVGTIVAIATLVGKEKPTSGFRRAFELGLIEYSLEAAVCSFPTQFSTEVHERALSRLSSARSRKK